MPETSTLTEALKAEARRIGFDLVGVAPAVSAPGHPRFLDWLDRGHAAGMDYLSRRADAREHPRHVLEGVRSVVVVGMIYGRKPAEKPGELQGRVARYAQGADYHRVVWDRLDRLLGWLKGLRPDVVGRGVCDTAPLPERDYARLAGLGWIGKNTCLIDRKAGSFTVLGALLVDLELDLDRPIEANHCGTCTRCLDACPTDAFDGPGRLDSRRCLSYWTIEHRGVVPDAIAERVGDWAFGCDICQDVCPWNRKAPDGREPSLDPVEAWVNPDLVGWLDRDPEDFLRALKPTAMSRARRGGLARNAALVLGARRSEAAVPALIRSLGDPDPVVRASCCWALGRIGTEAAREALGRALEDPEADVRASAARALANCQSSGG